MKFLRASPSLPTLICLFVVPILAGIVLPCGLGKAGMPVPTHAPPGYQYLQAQLAAVQPGRRGVTEEPGRRGSIEQEGRPGAEADYPPRPNLPAEGRMRPIIVEAMLNRRLSVPLMLDTGASYTMLTRQTALELGITGLERLPKQPFLTPGGKILSPITTLKSIRVETAEAQNVAVAIDVEGHLPLGLLGMTFLRHFKVTVNHGEGQVKFEHR